MALFLFHYTAFDVLSDDGWVHVHIVATSEEKAQSLLKQHLFEKRKSNLPMILKETKKCITGVYVSNVEQFLEQIE